MQNNCQSKHKKRKRHVSTDDRERASCTSAADAAEPATDDAETSTSLVSIDQSQQHCRVEVETKKKKKKKHKLHSSNNGHSMEDRLSSNMSSRQSEEKMIRDCIKEAASDYWLVSSQNPETFPAAQTELDNETVSALAPLEIVRQPTDTALNGHEHEQTASVTSELLADSSITALLSPAQSQVNDSHLVHDGVKLSNSAKRRRRRHRGKKSDHRKDDGNVPNEDRVKNTSAADGSSFEHVLDSNILTHSSHSLASAFGRTHIVFDNANSDDETSIKAHTSTQLTHDKHDSRTVEDQNLPCDTVVADGTVNNGSDAETLLQHGNSASSGVVVCSDVKKDFTATQLSSETKVCHPAKNAPFANVQVYSRQRNKKSASGTYMPHNHVMESVSSPLPKQASIIHPF